MTTTTDYFESLPAEARASIQALAQKHLGADHVPDFETAFRLWESVQDEIDRADVYLALLDRTRNRVLSLGLPWTQENLARYAAEEAAKL
ncbi:hypothetical protein BH09ACT7_BH09ACT7_05020 [soil metagenome]